MSPYHDANLDALIDNVLKIRLDPSLKPHVVRMAASVEGKNIAPGLFWRSDKLQCLRCW